jgi:hypothetical protein
VPTPLIDNEPGPVHGRPVSGFVPVVLGSSPVGIVGETGFSLRGGKTVVFPLSTGLTVFPLSIGLLVFCAAAAVAVAIRTKQLRLISARRFAVIRCPPGSFVVSKLQHCTPFAGVWKRQSNQSSLPAALIGPQIAKPPVSRNPTALPCPPYVPCMQSRHRAGVEPMIGI